MNILDVGGGAGLILRGICDYIQGRYCLRVNKYILDLSESMIEIQKMNNSDLKLALNEDIRNTSLADREIDIALMIDVLEHVPNSAEALKELKRISRYAIFSVPIENNSAINLLDFLKSGKIRRHLLEQYGHVNIYNFESLKYQLEQHLGDVIFYQFNNVFDRQIKLHQYETPAPLDPRIRKLGYSIAKSFHTLSPRLCSLIFGDSVTLLVKCY
jgi:ubiquinone/menaquinone biosynthesis C-methylase UbiE